MLGKTGHAERVHVQVQLVDEETGDGSREIALRIDRYRQVPNPKVADFSLELALAVGVQPEAASDAVSANFTLTLSIPYLVNSIAEIMGRIMKLNVHPELPDSALQCWFMIREFIDGKGHKAKT